MLCLFYYTIQCNQHSHQCEDSSGLYWTLVAVEGCNQQAICSVSSVGSALCWTPWKIKKTTYGNSLEVQWLGLGAFTAGTQIRFLVRELRSLKLCVVWTQEKKGSREQSYFIKKNERKKTLPNRYRKQYLGTFPREIDRNVSLIQYLSRKQSRDRNHMFDQHK